MAQPVDSLVNSNPVKITDENETNVAGVTAQKRLLVDLPISPTGSFIYSINSLKNGSSEIMTVNGSVTPVDFTYTPPAGQTQLIEELALFVQHNGTPDPTDFAAISGGLTNGLLISVRISGVFYDIYNVQNNIQLGLSFSSDPQLPSAAAQWYNNNDSYAGTMKFNVPIKLIADNGDQIRVRVRDNLSSLDNLRVIAKLWRQLS